jgi:hypothetical protein
VRLLPAFDWVFTGQYWMGLYDAFLAETQAGSSLEETQAGSSLEETQAGSSKKRRKKARV